MDDAVTVVSSSGTVAPKVDFSREKWLLGAG
jgi:hypothetical protein